MHDATSAAELYERKPLVEVGCQISEWVVSEVDWQVTLKCCHQLHTTLQAVLLKLDQVIGWLTDWLADWLAD